MKKNEFKKAEQTEKEYEQQMAHRYNNDYLEPPIMQEHASAFVKYVSQNVKPGDRVLDLGCASATLWGHFKKLLPDDITLVGVDLSPEMLNQARVQFPEGDFREGSFLDIPSKDAEFDVVIVSSAFHHINDLLLPDSLKEISRVMDEHGILIGREPLLTGRLGDRGGWFSGLLMSLRHLVYRLTHTREYPEPDPGIDHHAYNVLDFLDIINSKSTFQVENITDNSLDLHYITDRLGLQNFVIGLIEGLSEMYQVKTTTELIFTRDSIEGNGADVFRISW